MAWIGGDLSVPDTEWESNAVVGNQYPKLSQRSLN